MAESTLDTSGEVERLPGLYPLAPTHRPAFVAWADLDAFTQGYIEALFATTDLLIPPLGEGEDPALDYGFSDLAPETLALILKDCTAKARELACPLTAQDGGAFWRKFMSKVRTAHLGDDGKVYLTEDAAHG